MVIHTTVKSLYKGGQDTCILSKNNGCECIQQLQKQQ